ncbi:MAG TPA: bifunctional phosphopantothenoylcysteine decarboxylase/phosphopantothenate--cysteine ligase CoaBC [Dehalococcoidia bacterium]|nr:bifunctional phosphopantothenoylcysteine decarboxylase/phosphopantothenate--cysteine ligase CoaBC [Dehalococcoidia bacterium]
MLAGRRVVLGVTGSIAAYKAAELASQLVQAGAQVDVVMTEAAIRFVTPLTFRSLTGRPVYVEMFDPETEVAEQHVALARQADAVVIAPATASTIARLAQGLASDMVSVVALATRAPILLAPAMDTQMFDHPATQANLALLQQRGVAVVGPGAGRLASGHYGLGRLAEVPEVIGALRWLLGRTKGDLIGRHIVVSAGGTQEPIDPVRFISNYSSGKMGYALAEAARDRGAEVALVSAPTALAAPYGVELAQVGTAMEMCEAIVEKCQGADALIMAAAVADYQPQAPLEQKLKREETRG